MPTPAIEETVAARWLLLKREENLKTDQRFGTEQTLLQHFERLILMLDGDAAGLGLFQLAAQVLHPRRIGWWLCRSRFP